MTTLQNALVSRTEYQQVGGGDGEMIVLEHNIFAAVCTCAGRRSCGINRTVPWNGLEEDLVPYLCRFDKDGATIGERN